MARAGLGFLAGADGAGLPAAVQAELLGGLERAEAMTAAARASVLAAFTAGHGHHADAAYSARSWLYHRVRVTRGAAAGYVAWAKRADRHGPVVAAMAEDGWLSEPWARTICQWTDKLPDDCRDPADEILVAAARAGVGLAGLAEIFAEILARAVPADPGEEGRRFGDRSVRLDTTLDGAGVLGGDLTPECAAFVGAVLDALAVPAGAGDDRTREQRYHDGLAEAMRRLLAAGLLPERAGQPVEALALMSLADLRLMDADSRFEDAWAEGSGASGPPRARARPRAAGPAAPGWTATAPAPWPATPRSPPSSPARPPPASWRISSPCASGSPARPPLHRQQTGRRRSGRRRSGQYSHPGTGHDGHPGAGHDGRGRRAPPTALAPPTTAPPTTVPPALPTLPMTAAAVTAAAATAA